MSVIKPYFRTSRQLLDNSYAHSGNGRYVVDPRYAKDPQHYVRAYMLIQKDLQELFDYVEPADQNLNCYSYRIHELLMRACIEIEANCKAILLENGYERRVGKDGRDIEITMIDYFKIEQSHRLSEYQVRVPGWSGAGGLRSPFLKWGNGNSSLVWYQTYNKTKHDRHTAFSQATFEQMLDAVAGCTTILTAQFQNANFSGQPSCLVLEGPDDGMDEAVGGYFRIKYPNNWPVADRYDFTWQVLAKDPSPFQRYPYP